MTQAFEVSDFLILYPASDSLSRCFWHVVFTCSGGIGTKRSNGDKKENKEQ